MTAPPKELSAEDIAAEAAAATEQELAKVKAEAGEENEAAAEITEADEPEMEVFYTFRWAPKPRNTGRRPQHSDGKRAEGGNRKGGPKGKGGKHGQRGKDGKGNDGPRKFESRPPKREKQIDPDNPFAQALMGLKDKT